MLDRDVDLVVRVSTRAERARWTGVGPLLSQPGIRDVQPGPADSAASQLANAKAEIETLQQRLFELTSYRLAYERLLGERASPPKADH